MIEDSYELSPLQQGMLYHHLLGPGSGVDIEQMVCGLPENLDVPVFRKAWEMVVARHAILRTRFSWEGRERPIQEVWREVVVPFVQADWRGLSETAQAQKRAEFLKSDRARGFLMNEAPMMRLALFQCGAARFELVWTFHHALLDGRSFPLVLKEVFAFYGALMRGEQIHLSTPRPYRDYIEWLRGWDAGKARPFWQNLLAGFASATPLVVDHAPAKIEGAARQGDQKIFLSPAATARLLALAGENDFTLNTLIQGAWALLLHRYSGEEDIVFGAIRACRRSTVEGAEAMVGLFINTLPVRVRINPDGLLLPWLRELRAQWIALRDHEHTALAQVQLWSEVGKGKTLFDSILVFENYLLNSTLQAQGEEWEARTFRLYEQTNFPITVTVYGGAELCLQIEFDRSRFEEEAIVRMLGHFKTLLEGMAANPQARLADVPLIAADERRQLVEQWNDTRVDYPDKVLLHQLFEAQAAKTPDAVALVFEQTSLTYRELDRRANQLAQHLRSLGVGADSLVGVCMERSVAMVVALYGILKAGGAYVPIDPEYPAERVTFMIADACVPVLLTQSHLAGKLPPHSARVLCLDSEWDMIARASEVKPRDEITSANLAYVIYTSGSTGKPKGAMNTHRGICNRLLWMQDEYRLTAADVVLQKTPFSFDVSVWEFFWPLLTGARLVLAKPGGHKDGDYLAQLIAEQKITTLHFVPSMLQVFLETPNLERAGCLRRVICSGEALPFELQERFFARMTAELHNLYGPTEAAVDVSYWACRRQGPLRIVPIGRPIANIQLLVLDRQLRPVPVGVPGELHIGGVGLGRGYLNRPELTAEKFIPHPFDPTPGARLYKTGDLSRLLPDGNIEYLGRLDNQVKIRGFRIELGEIEAALGQHPKVKEAVVVAREIQQGDKGLVAYVVGVQGDAPAAGDLRTFLREKLPEYMVPAFFVALKAVPLSPNGKVDRRALPAPDLRGAAGEKQFAPPADALDAQLVGIWEQVLGVQPVGIRDNFYDLGGHSLLAVRLFGQIEKILGKKLPLATIFEAPTIEQLAAILRNQGWAPPQSSLVAIQPGGSKPPFFCVPPDDGTVLCFGDLARRLGNDQPLYGLEPVEMWGDKLIKHYAGQIRAFQPEGPYYLAGRCGGALITLHLAQELIAQSQRVAFLGMFGVGFPPGYQHPPFYMLRRLGYLLRHNPAYILNPRLTIYNLQTKLFVFRRKFKKRLALIFSGVKTRQVQGVLTKRVEAIPYPVKQIYPGRITLFETNNEVVPAWSKWAAGGVECHTIKTGHVTMLVEPYVEVLAGQVQACLARAHAENSQPA